MSANDEFASVALVESTINESTTVSTCLRTTSRHWSNQRPMNGHRVDVSANDDLDNPVNEMNVAPLPDVIDEFIQNYNDREKTFERLLQKKVLAKIAQDTEVMSCQLNTKLLSICLMSLENKYLMRSLLRGCVKRFLLEDIG